MVVWIRGLDSSVLPKRICMVRLIGLTGETEMENIMKEVETALGLLILDLVQQSIDIHAQTVQNLGGNKPIGSRRTVLVSNRRHGVMEKYSENALSNRHVTSFLNV